MYGVIREFQAPMGVTHAVRGRFGPTHSSLAVVFARKNSLDTYVVRANTDIARLELLQSAPLGANIMSIAALRRGNADLLLVAFDRLRVAIMSWHCDVRDWATEQLLDIGSCMGGPLCSPSSIMRSLDPEDYGRPLLRGEVGDYGEAVLRADPSGRCFAVLSKKQSAIYVVPLRGEDDPRRFEDKFLVKDDVFMVDLPSDYSTANVKDFVFLHGSFEPNILVLLEPKRTWAGRAAIQRNTCQLLNISVDIRSKKHSKSWSMDQLPYDSQKLEAVPESAGGGALVVSVSVILQVRHGACTAGLALNFFGDAYVEEVKGKYDTITASDTLVECDAAHCRFLDFEEKVADASTSAVQCIALLSLKGGELYFLSIAAGSRSVMSMKRAGSTVIASEIVPINERFFVLASRLSDSLLIEYQQAIETAAEVGTRTNGSTKPNGKAASDSKQKSGKRKKRRRTADEEAEYEMMYGVKPPLESSDEESDDDDGAKKPALELEEKDEGTRGEYDDEDELGWVFNSGADLKDADTRGIVPGKWALKVKDTLTCFGPGADLAVGTSPEDLTNSKLDLVIAGGYGKNGCLAVVHQSVRPTNRTEFQVPDCHGSWTLVDPGVIKKEKIERERRNAAVSSRNAARRAHNAKMQTARERYIEESIARLRDQAQSTSQDESPSGNHPNENEVSTKKDNNAVEDMEKHAETALTEDSKSLAVMENSKEMRPRPGDLKDTKEEEEALQPATKRLKLEGEKPYPVRALPIDEEKEKKKEFEVPGEVIATLEHEAEASFPLEPEEALEEELHEGSTLHSYMLLSTSTQTTALKTGFDIEELMDKSVEFIANECTVAAGNVLNNHATVQVVPSRVRVLKDGKNQCEYVMPDSGNKIKFAQVSDPLVLLQTARDQLLVLSVGAEISNDTIDADALGNSIGVPQEPQFDEYGMALSTSEQIHLGKGNGVGPRVSSKEAVQGPSKESKDDSASYRKFSLSIVYSSREHVSVDEPISCAFLYKGPIASELAKSGILSKTQEASVLTKESVDEDPQNPVQEEKEAVPKPLQVVEKEGIQEPSEENQIDDEDRMLYGDDNTEEEDMMLYGSGAGEKDAAKKKIRGNAEDSNGNSDVPATSGETGTNDGPPKSKLQDFAEPPHTERGVLPMATGSTLNRDDQHLLVFSSCSGKLKILAPTLEWQVVLEHPLFFVGPSIVEDIRPPDDGNHNQTPGASTDFTILNLAMVELAGSALVPGLSTPILVAVSKTGIPLIYRAFLSSGSNSANSVRSRLVLRRIDWRDRTAHLFARSMNCLGRMSGDVDSQKGGDSSRQKIPIIPFTNIAGRGGLFVGGRCPFFLFAERGYPRVHPVSHGSSDGTPISKEEYEDGKEIVGFTEFHNVKCPRGFVSVGIDGMVRIGELAPPSVMNYDAPTPIRKVALRCTPHKVAYHAGSATYGVLASMPTLTTREERLARILQSLEKHDKRHYQHTVAQAEAETGDERAKRVPPLFEELHELRVYRPDTWELIKSFKLQKGEVGLALANMKVDVFKQQVAGSGVEIPSSKRADDGNESAFAASVRLRPKDMLVVGTGYLNGEDSSSRGRLLLFEVSRQEVYRDGAVFTAFQLQLIAEKELFSPVTAVASMEGYVIAGVGPQISVYKLVGDEIIHLSFAFGQLYCTAISSLKQYVVAADMCKSVSFMYFRERNNSVNFLGKDYEHVTSYAAEFLLEHENMSIVVSDGKANVQLMNYAHASVPESQGGKRLLINGGTHFGSRINKFVRVRAPDRKQDIENGRVVGKAGRHSLVFTTLDGGLGAVVAVTEVEFRKLKELKERIITDNETERYAGVNPLEQTAFRPESASTVLLDQRILDSRVIFEVFGRTLIEQRIIARGCGTGLDQLARNMLSLDEVLYRF
eukprot:GFKZ01011998.1.p1 GENE.GFKZ01011998.1~~GFKZ01011998.1.p1  ORF type:complete len:1886 (+),score=288.95 GFKZ01011998.1:248-5905(+)